ncbi:hypothetical protein GF312_13990 [Candidatus Poribacteria bacterium]|nr:hypothetical protein [Candidatus Poribacteria bacterium]
MIGKAVAERDKSNAIKNRQLQARREEEEQKAEEERELQRLNAIRKSLSEDEQVELRERARQEIRDSGEYKSELVTEPLITARENEILKRENL